MKQDVSIVVINQTYALNQALQKAEPARICSDRWGNEQKEKCGIFPHFKTDRPQNSIKLAHPISLHLVQRGGQNESKEGGRKGWRTQACYILRKQQKSRAVTATQMLEKHLLEVLWSREIEQKIARNPSKLAIGDTMLSQVQSGLSPLQHLIWTHLNTKKESNSLTHVTWNRTFGILELLVIRQHSLNALKQQAANGLHSNVTLRLAASVLWRVLHDSIQIIIRLHRSYAEAAWCLQMGWNVKLQFLLCYLCLS